MTQPTHRGLLATVAVLYAAEGLPAGIFHELVQVWLIQAHDLPLSQLGLVTLLAIPWTLKALWSPLIDRFGTAARWISTAMMTVALATAVLPLVPVGAATWWILGLITAPPSCFPAGSVSQREIGNHVLKNKNKQEGGNSSGKHL